jgi:hypothetical protein
MVPRAATSSTTAEPYGRPHPAYLTPRQRAGITLRWRTRSESGLVGFNLYRSDVGKVNRTLIPSVFGGTTRGHTYSFLDRKARRGLTYTYRLQAVGRDGSRTWLGTAARRQ